MSDMMKDAFRKIAASGMKILITPEMKAEVERELGRPFEEIARALGATFDVIASEQELPRDEPVIIVCLYADEPTPYSDNAVSECQGGCGRKVQYRPHHPDWTIKMCGECAAMKSAKEH